MLLSARQENVVLSVKSTQVDRGSVHTDVTGASDSPAERAANIRDVNKNDSGQAAIYFAFADDDRQDRSESGSQDQERPKALQSDLVMQMQVRYGLQRILGRKLTASQRFLRDERSKMLDLPKREQTAEYSRRSERDQEHVSQDIMLGWQLLPLTIAGMKQCWLRSSRASLAELKRWT
jgi:hypothetical protein